MATCGDVRGAHGTSPLAVCTTAPQRRPGSGTPLRVTVPRRSISVEAASRCRASRWREGVSGQTRAKTVGASRHAQASTWSIPTHHDTPPWHHRTTSPHVAKSRMWAKKRNVLGQDDLYSRATTATTPDTESQADDQDQDGLKIAQVRTDVQRDPSEVQPCLEDASTAISIEAVG